MKNKIKDNIKDHNNKTIIINMRWIIGNLIFIIILILTFKIWGKPEPLVNLISISSGLISIVLSIFAIAYSISESIKTNYKENNVNIILRDIKDNVKDMSNIVNDVKSLTNTSLVRLSDIENNMKNFDYIKFYKKINEKEEDIYSNYPSYIPTSDKKNISHKIKKGDICWVSLGEKKNSLMKGKRLAIVVQNNLSNKYTPTITVVPITTAIEHNNIITHISFNFNNKLNTIIIEQMLTISCNDILHIVDQLDKKMIYEIDKAILFHLGINS